MQNLDSVIQTQTCLHCQSSFEITQGDINFYTKISPKFGEQRFQIPTPTLCPDCRQRKRMAFRNERTLYRRICDASKQPIISMYNPECGYKVYDQKIWFSDQRNAKDYAIDFDFGKTFTQNIKTLSIQVPRPSMYNYSAHNSEYCNCTNYQKDCYLTSASGSDEKCMYAAYIERCNSCLDCIMCFDCENCYYCIDMEKSYGVSYGSNCKNCSESYFLSNCNDCSFCRNCENLENKKYCIDNISYEKEEYNQRLFELKKQQSDYMYIRKSKKQKHTILFSENCTGRHIRNSKNSINCLDISGLENCKNCTWFANSRYCMDNYSRGQNSQMCYENVAIGENNYGILFCSNVNTNCRDILYSMHCRSCNNLFACIGLLNSQYCIFNKQYTKEEYEVQVAKIIAHMIETKERGEFFHPSLSPFGYNETIAMEYYPTQKGELSEFGYQRSDYQAPAPVADNIISADELPDIDTVGDDILQKAICCEVTEKLFRLQRMELEFYRKHNIPLPRRHPDQRHLDRLALRK